MNMLNLSIAVTAAAALVLLLKLLFGNKITPRGHMLLWLLPAVAMPALAKRTSIWPNCSMVAWTDALASS